MTNNSEPQTFDEAVVAYSEFLQKCGFPTGLTWVEPGDILLTGTRTIYIRLPVPQANLVHARERFEAGLRSGLGVWFQTLAELKNSTCCFAFVPEDEADQMYHLLGDGLKMSAQTDQSRRKGIGVRSRLRWALLKRHFRKHSWMIAELFG